MNESKNALIIFTRNPELGKVKTRLAATIGDFAALDIYKFLIDHTVKITSPINADKFIFYSEDIQQNDAWNPNLFIKELQNGKDLGERMKNAFDLLFKKGYQKIVIVGSDIYELDSQDIEDSFITLKTSSYVIGPAKDGGYYLLGMRQLNKNIFENKNWGTDTVFNDTIIDLKENVVALLSKKNDIDIYADIKNMEVFNQILIKK
ncbi:MAG: TIGR04282 family arsenosugar biosynthesis glycosyltransferase [Flavobacteriaceae bacterium]|nr:TIGR04282 family arsenosugar biosynthesis glycosyltransferase [Flavobacteriaceae bacterium]